MTRPLQLGQAVVVCASRGCSTRPCIAAHEPERPSVCAASDPVASNTGQLSQPLEARSGEQRSPQHDCEPPRKDQRHTNPAVAPAADLDAVERAVHGFMKPGSAPGADAPERNDVVKRLSIAVARA